MATFRHLYHHIKSYGFGNKGLILLSLVILFWAIFDGIISFVAPLIITQNGISKSLMGIIIGSSSVAGALFDFLMCRIFKSTFYRRMFLIMFAVCFIFPLVLWQAKTLPVYLIAMVLWGIYYDLCNFGRFDFITRRIDKEENASSFGVIHVFYSLGYLVAPLLAALVIGDMVDWKPFVMAWVLLLMAFLFFLALLNLTRRDRGEGTVCRKINFLVELHLWQKIGRVIYPVLLLTFMLNVIDAFVWTIGPLLAVSFGNIRPFGGLLLAAYSLPPLLVGWFVGSFAGRYGKKKTALYALLFGSLILLPLFLFHSALFIIPLVFFSSCFISLSWPAVNGVYTDYMEEARSVEKEIEGLEDFFANLGYIVGPIIAGILADLAGDNGAFSVLALLGIITAIILIRVTPRHVNVRKELSPENMEAAA